MAVIKKSGREKITTAEMEIAVAEYFCPRRNLVVPNVHWGMFFHECDVLVLTPAGIAQEVEIKISKADLKKDAEKKHGHFDSRIRKLWFAVPDYLVESCLELAPERAGVLAVYKNKNGVLCKKIRAAKDTGNHKFSDDERYKVARLGALRIWGLKRKLVKRQINQT